MMNHSSLDKNDTLLDFIYFDKDVTPFIQFNSAIL